MELDDRIKQALLAELRRQADREDLSVTDLGEDRVRIDGTVDLADLAMALIGTLAGGP